MGHFEGNLEDLLEALWSTLKASESLFEGSLAFGGHFFLKHRFLQQIRKKKRQNVEEALFGHIAQLFGHIAQLLWETFWATLRAAQEANFVKRSSNFGLFQTPV